MAVMVGYGVSGPGQQADHTKWRYDVRDGWQAPSTPSDPKSTQFVMPHGFDPATRSNAYHVLVSPPGQVAPLDLPNYTPPQKGPNGQMTGNVVHGPGFLAPQHLRNLTLVPSRAPTMAPAAGPPLARPDQQLPVPRPSNGALTGAAAGAPAGLLGTGGSKAVGKGQTASQDDPFADTPDPNAGDQAQQVETNPVLSAVTNALKGIQSAFSGGGTPAPTTSLAQSQVASAPESQVQAQPIYDNKGQFLGLTLNGTSLIPGSGPGAEPLANTAPKADVSTVHGQPVRINADNTYTPIRPTAAQQGGPAATAAAGSPVGRAIDAATHDPRVRIAMRVGAMLEGGNLTGGWNAGDSGGSVGPYQINHNQGMHQDISLPDSNDPVKATQYMLNAYTDAVNRVDPALWESDPAQAAATAAFYAERPAQMYPAQRVAQAFQGAAADVGGDTSSFPSPGGGAPSGSGSYSYDQYGNATYTGNEEHLSNPFTDPNTGDVYVINQQTGAKTILSGGGAKTANVGTTIGTIDRGSGKYTPTYAEPQQFKLGRSEMSVDPLTGTTTKLATDPDPWSSSGDLFLPPEAAGAWDVHYPGAPGIYSGVASGNTGGQVNTATSGNGQALPPPVQQSAQPGTGGKKPVHPAAPHRSHRAPVAAGRQAAATLRPLRQTLGLAGGTPNGAATAPPVPASLNPLNSAPTPAPVGPTSPALLGAGDDQSGSGMNNYGFNQPQQTAPNPDIPAPDYSPFGGKGLGFGGDTAESWTSPLDEHQIVGVGNRFNEPTEGENPHKGFDLQAYEGQPLRSPVDGQVNLANHPEGLGHLIIIVAGNGDKHHLGHVLDATVKHGQMVRAGDTVGHVGSTGKGSSGPHLDYRIQKADGTWVDPATLFPQHIANMPEAPGTVQPGEKPAKGKGGKKGNVSAGALPDSGEDDDWSVPLGMGDDNTDQGGGGGDPGSSDSGGGDPNAGDSGGGFVDTGSGQYDPGGAAPPDTSGDTSGSSSVNSGDTAGSSPSDGSPASWDPGSDIGGNPAGSNPIDVGSLGPSSDASTFDPGSAVDTGTTGAPSAADQAAAADAGGYNTNQGYSSGGPAPDPWGAIGTIGSDKPDLTAPLGALAQGASDLWNSATASNPVSSSPTAVYDPTTQSWVEPTNPAAAKAAAEDAAAQVAAQQASGDQQKQQQAYQAWLDNANMQENARNAAANADPLSNPALPGNGAGAASVIPATVDELLGSYLPPMGAKDSGATGGTVYGEPGFTGNGPLAAQNGVIGNPDAYYASGADLKPTATTTLAQANTGSAGAGAGARPAAAAPATAPAPAPVGAAGPPKPEVVPPLKPPVPPVPPVKGQIGLTPAQQDASNRGYAAMAQQQAQFLLSSALKNPWLQSLGAMMPQWNTPGGPNAAAAAGGLDPNAIPTPQQFEQASPFVKAAWMTARIINTGKPFEVLLNELRNYYGTNFNVTGAPVATQQQAAEWTPQDLANYNMLQSGESGQTPQEAALFAQRSWLPSDLAGTTNLGY